MKQKLNLSTILLTFLTVFLLILCGCNKNKQSTEPQAKQMKETGKEDKVPEDLEKIESSIEKIIKALEGPAVSIKDEEEENQNGKKVSQSEKLETDDKDSNKDNQDKGSGESENNDNKEQKSPKEDESKDEQKKAAASEDPWQKISATINKLHYEWNAYIPAATKKNASRDLIDNFDNLLNNLTSNIVTKDKNKTLLAANSLYQHIPDFYMLYKTPASPEIKRIRYYIRNAVLNATILNWEQASKDIDNLKSTWAIYKNTIDPKNKDLESKLDYSIYELEKVVKANDVYLTDIKGRIAISNTESLEKAEKEKEKGK